MGKTLAFEKIKGYIPNYDTRFYVYFSLGVHQFLYSLLKTI